MASGSKDGAGRALPKVVCLTPKIVVSTTEKDKDAKSATSRSDVKMDESQDAVGASNQTEKGVSNSTKPTEGRTTQLVALPKIKVVASQSQAKSGNRKGDTVKQDAAGATCTPSDVGNPSKEGQKAETKIDGDNMPSSNVTGKSQNLQPSSESATTTTAATGAISTDDTAIYECKICNAFFMMSSLKIHAKEHTKTETEICSKCGHFERDGGPVKTHPCYVCMQCATTFRSQNRLNKHMLLVHHNQSYQDAVDVHSKKSKKAKKKRRKAPKENCRSESGVIEKVRRGRWVEKFEIPPSTPDDTFLQSCRGCNKFFSSQANLEQHVKDEHTGFKTQICPTCGYFNPGGGPLRVHLCQTEMERKIAANQAKRKALKRNSLAGTSPIKERHRCGVCSKSYAYMQGLRAHMNNHKPPSEKPFHCYTCGKTFSKKTLFKDHLRIHTGEKPYLCQLCAKTFRSGANLRQHQRRCKERKALQQQTRPQAERVTFEVAMEVFQEGEESFVIELDPIHGRKVIKGRDSNNTRIDGQVMDFEPGSSVDHIYKSDRAGTRVAVQEMPVDTQTDRMQQRIEQEYYHGDVGPVIEDADDDDDVEPEEQIAVQGLKQGEVTTGKGAKIKTEEDFVDMKFPEPPTPAPPAGQTATDHDYSKDHPKNVLEEHPVGDNIQADYLEVCFMCTKCYFLNDTKLAHKKHMMKKHGQTTKSEISEGILVLARSRNLPGFEGDEEDIIPLVMFYQCSHCNGFYPVDDIEKHMESIDITDEMCKTCYRIHKTESKSKCKLSRARKVFQCPYCTVNPLTRCDLKHHLLGKHSGAQYSCTLCDKQFQNRRALASHMLIHKDKPVSAPKKKLTKVQKKYYPCTKCEKVLTDRQQLRVHLMHHTNPKPFACKLCEKRFPYPSGLRVHMRGHTNNLPYLCEFCSKAFKVKACLTDHIRCHTGDKPFVCESCGKSFRTKANLRQHTQRCNHSADRVSRPISVGYSGDASEPFFCETCGKLFKSRDDMVQHSQGCAATLAMQRREVVEADKSYFIIIPQDAGDDSAYQEVTLAVDASTN